MGKVYALYEGDELLMIGTVKEIGEKMGVSHKTISNYKTKAHIDRTKHHPAPLRLVELRKEYALYKGDKLLSIGTMDEIAEEMGITRDTLRYYQAPVYARRTREDRSRRLVQLEFDVEQGEV